MNYQEQIALQNENLRLRKSLSEAMGALRKILEIYNKNSNNHYNPEPRISTIATAILAKRKGESHE